MSGGCDPSRSDCGAVGADLGPGAPQLGAVEPEGDDGSERTQPPTESDVLSSGALCGGVQPFGGLLHFVGLHYAWNGTAWVTGVQARYGYIKNRFLSGTQGQSTWGGSICRLAAFDDGSGEKLVLAGDYAGAKNSPSTGTILPYTNLSLGAGVDGKLVSQTARRLLGGS